MRDQAAPPVRRTDPRLILERAAAGVAGGVGYWRVLASVDSRRGARCTQVPVPRKVRELIQDLQSAGFSEVRRRGRGSHRIFAHPDYHGVVTISGNSGHDAKSYQENQVRAAVREVESENH